MKTLRECIQEAEEKKVAIGHYNISNIETLWGIVHAAESLKVPVIIGLSEGERSAFGVRQAKAVVESIRQEHDIPLFINADHSYSLEHFKEAVDARYDAAIFDGAKLSFDENVAQTKKCVSYARSVDPEMLVEAELGYIGSSSEIIDAIPEGVSPESMTKPEEAEKFVQETEVDLFAPSVGNIHGIVKDIKNPKLDIERITQIREAAGVPLVLHGGSGITIEDFKAAIAAGISIVHINTDIRIGFIEGVKKGLEKYPEEVAPYKLFKPAVEAVQSIVTAQLKLFNNI